MTTLRRTWQFVAGDSLLTPLAVLISIAAVVLMHHFIPHADAVSEVVFVGILGLGIIAGVFERTNR
jgi:uncharacterized membrane protein YoaK (UPF0700 family)